MPDSVIPKNPDLRSAIASATSGPRVIRRQFIPATAIEAIQKALEAMPPPAPVELRTITPSFQPDHISIKDAIVEPGQVVELRFDLLENTEHAAFLCTRTTPDTRVTLIHPDGTALTFPEPPSLAEDEVASLFGVRMLEVANLPKGIYIVRVENSSPSPICVTASCQFTGIAPEVRIRLDEEQRQIVAWLERSDEVVQTDNLPLRCLYEPCSSLGNTDDEQMPSAAEPTPVALTSAGNGRYTADLPELLEGEYEFRAEWLDQFGEAASEAEVRYGNYLVTGKLRPLNDPGTKIPGPYTDYCFSPPNKLLLCKGIRIGIDATVSRPGDYAVTASLCDKNGTELAQGFCHQSAPDAGALHFDLEFDCGQVYALEIDGPYLLQDITLEYLPENATPKRLDVIASHQTASFRWQDFDTQPFRITDDVQDWLETVNSDGRETSTLLHIRFHVQVPVTIENNFAFSATLRTSTGQTIRSVEAHPDFQGPEDLTSGLWPVEMVFDTGDLLDTEVPGPYTLFNICAHRKNPSEYLPLEDEIETRAYQLDQFAYPMTTLAMNDYPGLEIKTTPFPDHPDTHMATLVITRQDNNPNDTSFLKYGDPLEGPFGIGLLDDDFTSGFQVVGAQTIELKAGKCQYLDCNDEVLRQLQDQGNHDDCLDDGETITLSFQYTCANGLGFTPPPIALLGRMRAPLGYHRHRNITAKCLSTDLDQNFQISDAEAAAARSKWEEGDLSHHILLQTLEFHQAPGYRFNPLLNDFEPLENGEAQ